MLENLSEAPFQTDLINTVIDRATTTTTPDVLAWPGPQLAERGKLRPWSWRARRYGMRVKSLFRTSIAHSRKLVKRRQGRYDYGVLSPCPM